MKTLIRSLVISLLSITALADIVPPIKWDIETGRLEPRPYSLSIRRGESVKIEPRFMSYSTPISLTNTTVEMRYASDYDMATYYSVAGILHTDTGRVEIAWSDSLNPTNSAMVYEIRATAGTNVLARAYGPLTFLGGMVGLNTGLTTRTDINWSTVNQANGYAVLSNQMGTGATWSGSNWTFAAGSSGISADTATNIVLGLAYPLSSNPSNYCTIFAATNGLGGYVLTNDARLTDARAPLAHSQPLSTITNAGTIAGQSSNDFLRIDQATPQLVSGGAPTFQNGIRVEGNIIDDSTSTIIISYLNRIIYDGNGYKAFAGSTRELLSGEDVVKFNWATMQFPTLTTDGLLKVSGGDGSIGVDTNTYLPTTGSGASLTSLDLNPSLTNPVALALSAVLTNDTRYLASLTNTLPATNALGYIVVSNGVTYIGTGIVAGVTGAITNGQSDVTLGSNTLFTGKVSITGTTDNVQLSIQNPNTQTVSLVQIIGSTSNLLVAPLVVQQKFPYVAPYQQMIQLWKDSGGTVKASIRADGLGSFQVLGAAHFNSSVSTVTVPAYHNNSQNAGMYFPSETNLGFIVSTSNSLGNFEAIRISAPYGNVGIGATSPTERLHVVGNAIIATNLTVGGTITSGGNAVLTNQWNDPCLVSSNLISMFSGTTCTWTRAWGNALNITPTGTVYFAADATLTDTNLVTGITLDLFYNGQTFGFVGASVTNGATLVSNAWNSIIFWKGRGSSVLIGK